MVGMIGGLLTALALGHGGYPVAYQVLETPSSASRLFAATTFGLLRSDDDGASWDLICEESIGIESAQSPVWGMSASGALLVGGFQGVFLSRDQGCTFASIEEFRDTGASDIRASGANIYVASGKYGVTNRVLRSRDDGQTWSPTSLVSAEEFYSSLQIAPSRPQRIYVAAWWFKPEPTEFLYRSDDFGDTFTRVALTDKLPGKGAFYVYAVDPTNPDVAYGVLATDVAPRTSYLLRSSDQGDTWRVVLETTETFNSVAIASGGTEVWAATSGKLYRSMDSGMTFTAQSLPTRYACAMATADRVYVCGWPEVDGFALARARGATGFGPVLTWDRLRQVAACPAGGRVDMYCASLFDGVRATLPMPGSDGGTGGGGEMTPTPQGGCRCALGNDAGLWFVAAAVLFSGRRAGRERRRR